jgi:DNA-binding MarR family transcriptional regulator|nr:MarR family transcriptional regulator [uncultured Lachnoclostridium sp.]
MQTEPSDLITMMHHLRSVVSQLRPQSELTFGEFCAMNMIEASQKDENQKLTPTSLNEQLGTKKPATSRMLTVLEKKGFLKKVSDAKDHRIYYLELTALGKQALLKERDIFHKLLIRICNRMGKDEIKQMVESLQKLGDILEDELELPSME